MGCWVFPKLNLVWLIAVEPAILIRGSSTTADLAVQNIYDGSNNAVIFGHF